MSEKTVAFRNSMITTSTFPVGMHSPRHWITWKQQQQTKSRSRVPATLPPYDCDEIAFKAAEKRISPEKLKKISSDLRNTVHRLNELEQDAVETKEVGLKIISLLTSIRNNKHEVYEVMQSIELKHRKIGFLRSARDKLVHKLFLVLEKIQVIESSVKHCYQLIESPIVFCTNERQDLVSILRSTENILRVMSNLNHSRNRDIASMYT